MPPSEAPSTTDRARVGGPRGWVRAAGALALSGAALATLGVAGVEVGAAALLTGLVLAALPAPIYVALALSLDRFEPEPLRMLAWAFFWGASGATLIALVLNTVGQVVVGSQFGSSVGELYGASVSAPVVEETAKAAVLLAIVRWRRDEMDGVLDGIVYAAMVGLGFALTENVLYYARAAVEGGVPLAATFFVRGVLAPFSHPLFTSMTGIGFGLALWSPRGARRLFPLLGLAAAVFLHSLWNTAVGLGGGLGFLAVYVLVMVPVFAAVVVVAAVALQRQGPRIRDQLRPDVEAGRLPPEELDVLSSLRARGRALRSAKRDGRDALRQRGELQRTATELALLRERVRRAPPEDRSRNEEEAALAGRLAELSSAAPAASAPAESLPPAGWYADPYGQARLRYWDGDLWTPHVHTGA